MCKSVNIFVFRSYQCCPGALRIFAPVTVLEIGEKGDGGGGET